MKKILLLLILALSELFSNNGIYLGIQSIYPTDRVAVKLETSPKVSVQALFDFMGEEKSYSFRGIYKFRDNQFYNIYGFAEIGLWDWDGGYHNSYKETAFGYGVGGGVEYDLRGLDRGFLPLFISAELNIYSIDFNDYYYDEDGLGLGFGLNYKF